MKVPRKLSILGEETAVLEESYRCKLKYASQLEIVYLIINPTTQKKDIDINEPQSTLSTDVTTSESAI